jgi:heptosyltransferase-1
LKQSPRITAACVITRERPQGREFLVQCADDEAFYRFPGGMIEFGETAADTICRELREERFDFAVDFQGLMKSALVASVACADRIFGFHQSQVREKPAALVYSHKTLSASVHVVEKNLDLATAAGAASIVHAFPLPEGHPEGNLPGNFVLACPFAGWRSKQWPLSYYGILAAQVKRDFDIPLVLDGPPGMQSILKDIPHVVSRASGLPGLISAIRRATAVVGVDSGPLHLAAALGKTGVAIFGPTDPARNGPYGNAFTVLRSPDAVTSYKRLAVIDQSMQAISPDQVFESLKPLLLRRFQSAGCIS